MRLAALAYKEGVYSADVVCEDATRSAMAFTKKAILFDVISLDIIVNEYNAVSSTEFKIILQAIPVPIAEFRGAMVPFSKAFSIQRYPRSAI